MKKEYRQIIEWHDICLCSFKRNIYHERTMDWTILIISMSIACITILAANWKAIRKKKKMAHDFEGVDYGVTYVVELLKSLGCPYEEIEHSMDEDGSVDYTYSCSYQGGHFILEGNSIKVFVKEIFPNIAEFSRAEIDMVRAVCNIVNLRVGSNTKVEYRYSENQDKINVNVVVGFMILSTVPNVTAYLKQMFSQAFYVRQVFDDAVKDYCEGQRDMKVKDVEIEISMRRRELYLLREAEVNMCGDNREAVNNGYSIARLVKNGAGLTDFIPTGMVVTLSDGTTEVLAPDAVMNYNICDAIVNINETDITQSTFKGKWANLVIDYDTTDDMEHKSLVIHIEAEGDEEKTLYMRITITQVAEHMKYMRTYGIERNQASANSFVVALDKVTDSAKVAEVKYMWQDMIDKVNQNKQDELTEEQCMLRDCSFVNLRDALYFGRKCFHENRFYEAINRFEGVFDVLRRDYDTLSVKNREVLDVVCFMLGFSYAELKQYDRALYYLDFVALKGQVKADMEYVNCLVNSGDHRALEIVDRIYAHVNELLKSVDEDSDVETIVDYRNFLLRRRSYILIEKYRLDEAEKMLQAMVNEPENSDFALNELNHIEQLRKKKNENSENEEE